MVKLLLHYVLPNGSLVTNSYTGQTQAQALALFDAAAVAGVIVRAEWLRM